MQLYIVLLHVNSTTYAFFGMNFADMSRGICLCLNTRKNPDHDECDLIIYIVETISESGVEERGIVDEINVSNITFNNPSKSANKGGANASKCEKRQASSSKKM